MANVLALENEDKFNVFVLYTIRIVNKSWQVMYHMDYNNNKKNCFCHANLSTDTSIDEGKKYIIIRTVANAEHPKNYSQVAY